ncbi:MAG: hypothetical protein R6V03_10635 [Kiritimatiellia bacterium]
MSESLFDENRTGARRGGRNQGGDSQDVEGQPISEAGLNRMAKQKETAAGQMSEAARQLEELRSKQSELESQRTELEQLTKQQEDYEKDKRDIVEKLERSLILVKREEVQAVRMAELLAEVRSRFKDTLNELKAIDEDSWDDEEFYAELNRAMTLVEEARSEHRKALARIDAAGWHKQLPPSAQSVAEERDVMPAGRASFGHYLKIGLAVTLPLAVIMAILFVAWLAATGIWPR